MRKLFLLAPLCLIALFGQEAREGAPGDAQRVVKIRRILVDGTRIPLFSVIRLAQIKAGDEVDFARVQDGLRKVTQTGLITNIDFEYESLPDSATDVILHLKCTDAAPSAKATIQIPNVNEDDVWTWLTQVDPLFTRDMPPNEAAIRLYSALITKYLETHGSPAFQEKFAIVANAANSRGGSTADRLTFKVVKRRGVK